MHPHTLRRVLKSLSPRKHNQQRHPQQASSAHPTPPADPSPPPLSEEDPSQAAENQYQAYLARLSSRIDENQFHPWSRPAPSSPPDLSNGHNLSDSPPPSPPFADRTISRIHRRAVRNVNLSIDPGMQIAPSSLEQPYEEDKENNHASPTHHNTPPVRRDTMHPNFEGDDVIMTVAKTSLPPMYVDVDPHDHFKDFVPVGRGGSGSVYFAIDKIQPSRKVALKKVRPSTPAKSRQLENEIRTMHALRHPNIVQCHESYTYQENVWIVMEAMDVGCLTHVLDFLRDKAYLLAESHIAYILREILHGLWAMHSRHCMHRDIKSDNVLVSSDGDVKLGDFEYTAVLTEASPKRRTVVGTAWWMAPETVRSSYYDYGADVWSIGILSIECAEWVPPLFGMESSKAMDVIREGATAQGFKRPDMWSVEFADFVRGCLTRDRDIRYTVPDLLKHPFLQKACSRNQIANVFRAVRGMPPVEED